MLEKTTFAWFTEKTAQTLFVGVCAECH